jgi:hypothetical protein
LAVRPAGLEPVDRPLPGLGVDPPVADVLGPRGEQVVELAERLDAVMDGFGQERLADMPVESFLFSPPFRRVGPAVDQPDSQHGAGTGQAGIGERRSVIATENPGQAAAGDRPAQQLLAGAGVLVREEPAVDQQPGMVIDDQEQPRPRRAFPLRERDPRADEHVADPPFVRRAGFVPSVCLRLCRQRLAAQPGPAQLAAHGPFGHRDAVPVIQDRGDLGGGPAGQLQPQRGGLGEQLRVGANRPAPAGPVIAGPPSSAASAANPAPIAGARTANRGTQPRAVSYGTPARAAAGRTPHPPPHTPASTAPIVPAVSSRQASTNDGSSAWLTAQRPQRSRGTKIFRHLPAART